MALVEVKKCRDINCKYVRIEEYCPEDWFDLECYGECAHPDAPKRNFLGSDRSDIFLDIPNWCPIRKDKVGDNNEIL